MKQRYVIPAPRKPIGDRVKIVAIWVIPWVIVAALTAATVMWGEAGFWAAVMAVAVVGTATATAAVVIDVQGWRWNR